MSDLLDDLTQLPGRASFISLLRRQIGYANEKQFTLALAVIDIDGFAQINIANGYAIGDAVLRHFARLLYSLARDHDAVARIGDNRFALLLPRVLNRGHAELALQKLERLLQVPFQSGGNRVAIGASAGIALCPEHASHAEYLLRKAETALAAARITGRRYEFASVAGQGHDLSDMWELEMQLDSAIERGELEMHYQPQIRMSDLQPIGAEALMRWHHPNRGAIPPDVFIPMAERTGQIKQLTIWALNTVLRQAGEWHHDLGSLSVSVNMPGDLATRHDLTGLVENAMRLWGKAGVQLVLEITERSLMDRNRGMTTLRELRELGARISIDDFGTGYSCLAYFKNIPADELKIDHSFVEQLLTDRASADITMLIVDLAKRFGLDVVGEGIEDVATFDALKAGGCDIAQGYLFARPMPADDFQRWLQAYQPQVPHAQVQAESLGSG